MLRDCVVGIDPGMTTGWCVMRGGAVDAGSWVLSHQSTHPLLRLHEQLSALILEHSPDLVCYEEPVARGLAARSLNRQMGVIILVCEVLRIPHYPVNPGTLKKHATGRGNATKEQMAEAWPGLSLHGDHNAVDAIWLADYGTKLVLPNLAE